jgi:beta-lactamase superfamily II metal-dependent hydrolase
MTLPLTYDGLEIEMLSLGNADSILVTQWTNSNPVRVLIDGGNISDGEKVLTKLATLGVTKLDHVVCSHPHDDHAGGLVAVLNSATINVGEFWMHLPWKHIDWQLLNASLSRAGKTKVSKIVLASLNTQVKLFKTVQERKIPCLEPFAGISIGPLFVCGPSIQFYTSVLSEFSDFDRLTALDTALAAYDAKVINQDLLRNVSFGGRPLFDENNDELGGEPTEPENDSSVVLYAAHGTHRFLFTADAGVAALEEVRKCYKLDNLYWMQIPHHGSRRNISKILIDYFKPRVAFVSAAGTDHHPRRKVVNAFKSVGSKVYSTHYPTELDLRQQVGNVPSLYGLKAATPLWD